MATLAEIRQKYPQYSNVDDTTLAKALHAKYYSRVPYETFASRIGLQATATPTTPSAGIEAAKPFNPIAGPTDDSLSQLTRDVRGAATRSSDEYIDWIRNLRNTGLSPEKQSEAITKAQMVRAGRMDPARVEDFAATTARGGIEGAAQNVAEFFKGLLPGGVGLVGVALKGGAGQVSQLERGGQDMARRQLDAMNKIDAGERVASNLDPLGYQLMGPDERRETRAQWQQQVETMAPPTPTSERALFKAGQGVEDFAKDLSPAKPGYEASGGRVLGEAVGTVGAGIALSAISPSLAAGGFALAGAGEAVERAVQAGATEEQIIEAAKLGILPGMTDSLPVEVLMGRLNIPLPMIGPALRAIARIGSQAFIEGAQEGGQQFLQNLIARETYDPNQKLGTEIDENAEVGAAVGAILQLGKEGITALPGLRRGRSGSGDTSSNTDDITQRTLDEIAARRAQEPPRYDGGIDFASGGPPGGGSEGAGGIDYDVERVQGAPPHAEPSPLEQAGTSPGAAPEKRPTAAGIDVTMEVAPDEVDDVGTLPAVDPMQGEPPATVKEPDLEVTLEDFDEEIDITSPGRALERKWRIAENEARLAGVTLPPNLKDPRLARPVYRDDLPGFVRYEFIAGGGDSGTLVGGRFAEGAENISTDKETAVSRAPSVNKPWVQGVLAETGMSVPQVYHAVDKALAGGRLGKRQAHVVQSILDQMSDERRADVSAAQEKLAVSRYFRNALGGRLPVEAYAEDARYERAGEGDVFTEDEYSADWRGESRSLYELQDIAAIIDADAVEAIPDGASPAAAARALWDIINRGADDGRETKQAGRVGAGESQGAAGPGSRPATEAARAGTATEEANRPGLTLTAPTSAELTAKEKAAAEAEAKKQAEADAADAKARADRERGDFTLTGSTLVADTNPSQGDLVSGAPARTAPAKETPPALRGSTGLAVEIEGKRYPVKSIEDASHKWGVARDKAQFGSRDAPSKPVIYQDGKPVAFISYNGKVWPGTKYDPDAKPLYDPRGKRVIDITPDRDGAEDGTKAQVDTNPDDYLLHPVKTNARPFPEPRKTDTVEAAAQEAATSPTNDKSEPTEAQKEAGNYKLGHIRLNGLDISIENPAGTSRRPEWPPLKHAYGYIRRTEGADGDHVDVFLGPDAEDASLPVFVVDQVNPATGKFDEHKVMLGFKTKLAARRGYKANYAKGWKGDKAITQMTLDEFKAWVRDGGKSTKPADETPATPAASDSTPARQAEREVRRELSDRESAVDQALVAAGGDERFPGLKAVKSGSATDLRRDLVALKRRKSHLLGMLQNKDGVGMVGGALAAGERAEVQTSVKRIDEEIALTRETLAILDPNEKERDAREPVPDRDRIAREASEKFDAKLLAAEKRKAAESARASKASKSAPTEKIADVGENLWYNRRNFTGKPVEWSDVSDLNDTLKIKEVVKSKVWPRPGYEQLVADGMPAFFARLVKQVYDGIGVKPSAKTPTDADLRRYLEAVTRIREALFAWARDASSNHEFMDKVVAAAQAQVGASRGQPTALLSLAGKDFSADFLDRVWPKGTDRNARRFERGSEQSNEARIIGGNRAVKAMQFTMDDLVKIMKDVEAGWPAKQEAWQRRGMRVAPSSEITITEGSRDGMPTWWLNTAKGWQGRSIGKPYSSQEAAETARDAMPAFMLLDKKGNLLGQFGTQAKAIDAARESTKRGPGSGRDMRGMNISAAEREGPARRAPDEDVTAERLQEHFGFRGVNFGRKGWINQAERQAYLNAAYDGLLDLADVLNVPPKALSIGGMLGIAFGAQGRGGAHAAHFVPGVNEINLTKTMGAGTLAHEWGHALDHHLAVQAGHAKAGEPFLSEAQRARPDAEIRPEMVDAMKAVVAAMSRKAMTPEEAAIERNSHAKIAAQRLDRWLSTVRRHVEGKAAAIAEYDQLAARLRDGDVGEGYVKSGNKEFPVVIAQIRNLVKDATGRLLSLEETNGIDGAAASVRYSVNRKSADAEHIPQRGTTFGRESAKKDGEKGGKRYWSTKLEMFARSFETFVAVRLQEREQMNTFLSDALLRAQALDTDGTFLMPYPRGDEQIAINQQIGKLVDSLKVREEDGRAILFNRRLRADTTRDTNVRAGRANAITEPLRAELGAHLGIDIPAGAFTEAAVSDADAALVSKVERIFGKKIVIFRNNRPDLIPPFNGVVVASAPDTLYIDVDAENGRLPLLAVIGHELTHKLRDERPELYDWLRDLAVAEMRNVDAYQRWLSAAMEGETGASATLDQTHEEMIADYIGTQFLDPTFWHAIGQRDPSLLAKVGRAVVDFLDRILRRFRMLKLKGADHFTDTQNLRDMVADVMAEYAIGESGQVSRGVAASRADAGFYSALEHVVAGKLPGRGTGRSMAEAIEAFQRKGLVKAEELEWVPVLDWLRGKGDEKVTRDEVVAFVRDNRVVVTPVVTVDYTDVNVPSDTIVDAMGMRVVGATRGLLDAVESDGGGNVVFDWSADHGGFAWLDGEMDDADSSLDARGFVVIDENGNAVHATGESEAAAIEELRREMPAEWEEAQEATAQQMRDNGEAGTKFGEWQLPGGKNYRETLVTLPPKGRVAPMPDGWYVEEDPRGSGMWSMYVVPDDDYTPGDNMPLMEEIEARTRGEAEAIARTMWPSYYRNDYGAEGVLNADPERRDYRNPHFDTPNVVVHLRTNERQVDNRSMFFIEEIQSDWHQAGRRDGYGSQSSRKRRLGHLSDADLRDILLGYDMNRSDINDAPRDRLEAMVEEEGGEDDPGLHGVPDAPFKRAWPLLGFKQALRMAVEGGHEVIGWTTGAQQARRYDLSKQVDSISVTPRVDARSGERTRRVLISLPGGRAFSIGVDANGVVDNVGASNSEMKGKSLEDIVGKEMAEKIMAVDGKADFSGDGLRIGGKGMRKFYDEMLVNEVNKYVKKWGAKVGTERIDATNILASDGRYIVEPMDNGTRWQVFDAERRERVAEDLETELEALTIRAKLARADKAAVHSLEITDAMRREVLRGLPTFSRITDSQLGASTHIVAFTAEQVIRPPDETPNQPRPDASPDGGLSVAAVEEAIAGAVLSVDGARAPQVRVVASIADLPQRLQDFIASERAWDTNGVHDPASGALYLVAENLATRQAARRVLAHEMVGHLGVEAIVKDWPAITERLRWLVRSGNARAAQIDADVRRRYGTPDEATWAKEFIAIAAEQRVDSGPIGAILKKIRTAIRRWLRAMGFRGLVMADAEIDQLLNESERYLRGEGVDAGGALGAPSGGAMRSAGSPTFYSQIERTLAAKLPGSGTPEQFARVVAAAQRKGEIKPEEAEWVDVAGWLDSLPTGERVSKADVLEWVRAHAVQVKPVVKGGPGNLPPFQAWLGDWMMGEGETAEAARNAAIAEYESAIGYEEGISRAEDGDPGAIQNRDDLISALDVSRADAENPEGITKFGEWQLPGGKNYRETLLTVPPREPTPINYAVQEPIDPQGTVSQQQWRIVDEDGALISTKPTRAAAEAESARFTRDSQRHSVGDFRSGHFDTPNVVVHLRTNERQVDNRSMFFIEEIQSDWHQSGREKGYRGEPRRPTEEDARAHFGIYPSAWNEMSADERAGYVEEMAQSHAQRDADNARVPDAPFKRAWPLLGFKQALRMAVEGGHEVIGWTTGAQQARRYDLSKQVDSISVTPRVDARSGERTRRVLISLPGGRAFSIGVDANGVVDNVGASNSEMKGKSLEDIVGKEMAEKIMAVDGKADFSGDGLRIGGKGMRKFYDEMLVNEVNKYVKKWGAKVGTDTVQTGDPGNVTGWESTSNRDGSTATVYSIEITDAMRDAVATGQPLFSRSGDNGNQTDIAAFRPTFSRITEPPGVGSQSQEDSNDGQQGTGHLRPGLQADQDVQRTVAGGRPAQGWARHTRIAGKRGPAVVYRGASSNLSAQDFQADRLGFSTGHGSSGLGVFFTQREAGAAQYGPIVETFHLDMRNPKVYDVGDVPGFDTVEEAQALVKRLRKQGHDGIIVDSRSVGGPYVFVAFNPEQVIHQKKRSPRFSRRSAPRPPGQHPQTIYGTLADGTVAGIAYPGGPRGQWTVRIFRSATGQIVDEHPTEGTAATRRLAEIALQRAGLATHTSPPPRQVAEQEQLYPSGFDAPSEGIFDYLVYKAQDKFRALDRTQRAIMASGRTIDESADAYLQEELFHGRAAGRIEEFQQDSLDPLMQAIAGAGLTIEQVDDYLHARHAPEANARLKEINAEREDNEALSGMSDAEAAAIVDESRAMGHLDALEAIAARVDAINEARLNIIEREGLETRETVQGWRGAYQHYVPLKREGMGSVAGGTLKAYIARLMGRGDAASRSATRGPARGRGFHVRGKESKLRAGSSLAVVNVLANVVAQYESTVLRAEKATVGRSLLRLVQANPNEDLWAVNKVESVARMNTDTGLIEYVADPTSVSGDHVLSVKVDGVEQRIWFNPNNVTAMRMASSMKNLGADAGNSMVGALLTVNRYLAIVNTSANPEFILSNLIRDVQTAGINLQGTEARAVTASIMRDIKKSWSGIRAAQKGDLSGQWARYFRELEQAGGTTGWVQAYDTIESREANLRSMMTRLQPGAKGAAVRVMRGVFDFVRDENTAVENAVRLSAFVHGRRAGLSTMRAASLAKNLTVNFNRRGDAGMTLNALYLFYNASIQGSTRVLLAAKSPRVQKVMGTIVASAVMMDVLNRLMGGDDDDGEPYYDKIPAWRKERNFIVMIPGSGGYYVKIPLPYGYNVLHVLGRSIGEALPAGLGRRDFSASEAAANFAVSVLGAFNPIGSESTLLQMVSPTFTDPVVQWAENKDFSGRTLRPTQDKYGVPAPEYTLFWRSASEPSKWASQFLNDVSGGNEVRPGAIDTSPALFDHIWTTVLGGVGRFAANLVDVPSKLATGELVRPENVPFLRKVLGSQSEAGVRSDFYDNIRAVELTAVEFKRYASDKGQRDALVKAHGAELSLVGPAKVYRKQMKAMRRHLDAIRADESLGLRERTAKARAVEERMIEAMKRLNGLYRSRVLPGSLPQAQ